MSWPERAIALCFTVLLPLNVAAQSIDELLDIDLSALVEMEVVTPGRRGQTAREAAANVTVVTKEMIHRRGYRTLDEVLRDIPGFDFTIGQPAGEFPAHFLFRGIGDVGQTKVLIMVDGIIRNDVSNGWVRSVGFDFAFADVDRIEVIAGPGSSLYGANAYAGIVNVITSRPSDGRPGLTVNSSLLLSTHETVAPEAMVAYRFRNGLNLQVAGRWYKTNGDGGVGRLDPGGFFHGNFEPDSVFTSEFGNIANDRLSGGERKPLPDGFGNDIDNLFLRGRLEKEGFSMGFTIWDRDEGLGSEVTGYEYFANTSGTEFRAHHRGYSGYAAYTYDVTEKLVSTSRGYFRSDRILYSARDGFHLHLPVSERVEWRGSAAAGQEEGLPRRRLCGWLRAAAEHRCGRSPQTCPGSTARTGDQAIQRHFARAGTGFEVNDHPIYLAIRTSDGAACVFLAERRSLHSGRHSIWGRCGPVGGNTVRR